MIELLRACPNLNWVVLIGPDVTEDSLRVFVERRSHEAGNGGMHASLGIFLWNTPLSEETIHTDSNLI